MMFEVGEMLEQSASQCPLRVLGCGKDQVSLFCLVITKGNGCHSNKTSLDIMVP